MRQQPLKIAFIKQTFKLKGGLEKYCLQISRALAHEGYDICLLTTRSDHAIQRQEEEKSSIRYTVFSLPLRWLKLSFVQLIWFDIAVRKWKKKNPDSLLFGFDRHFIPLSIYRAGNGCHKAYLERRKKESSSIFKKLSLLCNPLHWLTLLTEKRTFSPTVGTEIICNSELVKKEILHFYPHVDPLKLHVIHNGVDWNKVSTLFEEALHLPSHSQKAWNVPSGAIHIVMVGHEWFRKGADILIEAVAIVKKKLPGIPLFVTIAGKERNPTYFIKLAEERHLREEIQFFPYPIDSNHLFQSANIAVVPSRYDPFANVTLEALSLGLWTVTSIENGGSEVIHEAIGYVAPELTAPYIAEGIITGMTKIMKLETTKSSIRAHVRQHDFSYALKGYIELVEKVAARKDQ